MVNHAVEAEELQALLDRELTPARQAEVEQHLDECRACSALLEELQMVSATLQQWRVEPAPGSLRPPAVESEQAERRWWQWPRLRVLALAGTAAVVLLVGVISLDVTQRAQIEPIEPRKVEMPMAAAPAPPAAGQATGQAGSTPASEGRAAATEPPTTSRDQLNFGLLRSRRQEADSEKESVLGGARERKAEEAESVAAEARPERIDVADAVDKSVAAQGEPPKEADEAAGRSAAAAQENRALGSAAAAQQRDQAAPPAAMPAMSKQVLASAPRLIAYEASLSLEVKDIEVAKAKLVKVVEESGGYIGEASSGETPGQARFADYTLRVPAENLSAAMDALRALGRVKQESLTSEEVTAQVVDLEARLRNARATEERLIAVLKEKTGKVRDILEVEREIAGTRESIERMEARREYLLRRVAFSTLSVTLVEEFKAQLQPAPAGTATRLRNAFVEGYENFAGTLLGLIFFFARHGLNLLFWSVLVWLSARLVWRALQRRYRWA